MDYNNNVNNANLSQAVANLLSETNIQKTMTEAEIFVQQMELNFKTWRNKRRGSDSRGINSVSVSSTSRSTASIPD